MPLGTEVGLGQGDTVLDGDPAPPAKGAQEPHLFGPCLLWSRSPTSATMLISCSVCASNISGTAERICAKFTRKTCLVPRSYDFKVTVKGQMSRSPGTKRHFSALSAACVRFVFGKTSLASSLYYLLQFKVELDTRVTNFTWRNLVLTLQN